MVLTFIILLVAREWNNGETETTFCLIKPDVWCFNFGFALQSIWSNCFVSGNPLGPKLERYTYSCSILLFNIIHFTRSVNALFCSLGWKFLICPVIDLLMLVDHTSQPS